MAENPYQSPIADSRSVVGVKSGTIEELRNVAKYQKGILYCILLQLLNIAFQMFLGYALKIEPTEGIRLIYGGLSLVVGIASTVFVFRLAINLYSTVVGIGLGVLTLIPCIGLFVLLIVNGKATSVLSRNGIKVGLMGANRSQI